jgi:hypothetical protein
VVAAVTDIRWEDPPQTAKPTTGPTLADPTLVAFADTLRANPYRWAVYPRPLTNGSANATARAIKTGVRETFAPAGTFEALTRMVDGQRRLYVRYVGAVVSP